MQAKDIDDRVMLTFVRDKQSEKGNWVNTWDFEDSPLGAYPPKVRLAKCKALIRRGLMDGCTCGCRGDFELTSKGYEFLSATQEKQV